MKATPNMLKASSSIVAAAPLKAGMRKNRMGIIGCSVHSSHPTKWASISKPPPIARRTLGSVQPSSEAEMTP